MCGREPKVGLTCQDTMCPWELEVERGRVVLSKPLRRRIK